MKTRSFVISIIAILFCFSGAHAQLIKGYGIKTGVVFANQNFNNSMGYNINTKNRTGFDFGISIEWFNLPIFNLLTEAHYVQKGMIEEIPRTDEYGKPLSPVKYDNRIDYLSIPILAKFSMKTKHISPHFVVGPRFDFNLDYKSELWSTLYNDCKNVDIGGTVGMGVESNTKPLKMLLEFRYSPDLTDAYKTSLWKIKNNSFELLLGLKL